MKTILHKVFTIPLLICLMAIANVYARPMVGSTNNKPLLFKEPLTVNIAAKRCVNNGVQIRATGKGGIPIGRTYRYSLHQVAGDSVITIRQRGFDSVMLINYNLLSDTNQFYVTIYDIYDSTAKVAFTIYNHELLMPMSKRVYDFCNGIADTIDGGNNNGLANSWRWHYNNTVIDSLSQRILPLGAGNYFVQKSHGLSCFVLDTIQVKLSQPINVKISTTVKNDSCEGNITLNSYHHQAESYQWFRNNMAIGNAQNATFTPQFSGQYFNRMIDKGLCVRFTDTVQIKVNPLPTKPVIFGPSINLDTINTYTYQLPSIPQLSYNWSLINATAIGNTNANTINVRFNNFGRAVISATVTNSFGCTARDNLHLDILGNSTGLNQAIPLNEAKLYPNPAKNVFFVDLNNHHIGEVYQIKLYNLKGELVLEQQSADNPIQVAFPETLNQSVYILKVTNSKEKLIYKARLLLVND